MTPAPKSVPAASPAVGHSAPGLTGTSPGAPIACPPGCTCTGQSRWPTHLLPPPEHVDPLPADFHIHWPNAA